MIAKLKEQNLKALKAATKPTFVQNDEGIELEVVNKIELKLTPEQE